MVVLPNSNTNNLTANKEKSCSACHFNCISETQKPVFGIVGIRSITVVPNGGHFGNKSNNIKFFLSDGSSAGTNIQQYKFLKMLRSSYLKNYRLKIITCVAADYDVDLWWWLAKFWSGFLSPQQNHRKEFLSYGK